MMFDEEMLHEKKVSSLKLLKHALAMQIGAIYCFSPGPLFDVLIKRFHCPTWIASIIVTPGLSPVLFLGSIILSVVDGCLVFVNRINMGVKCHCWSKL